MGLSHARRRSEKDDIFLLAYKVQVEKAYDLLLVELGEELIITTFEYVLSEIYYNLIKPSLYPF
jgi:hypothetical protein